MIEAKYIEKPKLVLIVDDQEINRDILGDILEEEERYDLIFAENGREALDLIHANADELSIVLLDLLMPVMNGFEVLEAMKKDERLRTIPVIVLTAERSAELQALQMGASDFITKPFEVAKVIQARVDRIIELSEGKQLISAAEHDRLTMLYSRSFFLEYADRLYQYHPELHLDAIMLNIEQFHAINELNGREFGDDVLRLIGSEIRAFLEETEGIASRIEADCFNIYCVCNTDYAALLERFQKTLNSSIPSVNIYLRMGVKPWREGVGPIQQLDQARTACNMLRGNYQNRLMVFDDNLRMKELYRRRLLNDLRMAVAEEQFLVCYQPKYDIQSDPPRLASAEALVRWKHPELGMIPPGDFIPLFESNGLISIVDRYVWQQAAKQVALWREKYGITLPVSVNVSRSEVFDPTLTEHFAHLIEENGLDYENIKLEITESAYTDDAKLVLSVIGGLRERGFEIEMDDFGSGYSSLNMLSDMPIDVLKMDMKFVRNIETGETDRRLVSLILDIAKYLRVKVVAEGVETEGQLEFLRKGNCNLIQGFYFSRPLPAEEFEKLIEREIAARQ